MYTTAGMFSFTDAQNRRNKEDGTRNHLGARFKGGGGGCGLRLLELGREPITLISWGVNYYSRRG